MFISSEIKKSHYPWKQKNIFLAFARQFIGSVSTTATLKVLCSAFLVDSNSSSEILSNDEYECGKKYKMFVGI